MKTKQKKKQPSSDAQLASIKEQVFEKFGKPPKLHNAIVVKISDFAYRVNLWVIANKGGEYSFMPAQVLAHSFFVKTDSDGKIVESNPEITKQY